MDYKFDLKLEADRDNFCLSIKKQKYIEIDGQREYIGEPHRRAFSPGQFEEIAEYAPEFEAMAQANVAVQSCPCV